MRRPKLIASLGDDLSGNAGLAVAIFFVYYSGSPQESPSGR